jgi:hypothetical protein
VKGFEIVASVIVAFFVIGIGVGVLLVVALPAFRGRRGPRNIGWNGEHRRPPGPEDDDSPPRWPGGTTA